MVALTASIGMHAAIPEVAQAMGHGRAFEDAGDVFEQAVLVVEYTDERLAAATSAIPLPGAPQLRGDIVTARIAYVFGVANDFLLLGTVALATWRGPRQLLRDFGLDRSPCENLARPLIAAAIVYAGLTAYALAVDTLGLGALDPRTVASSTLLRDDVALGLFAVVSVIGAPLTEEVLFRGFIFGGILKAGFVPAAIISSAIFAAWHFEPATLVPIGVTGLVMAWLYWETGTLWQPIVFHGIVNLVAFVQFVGQR